eukprot:Filipodium_phascolosomae@DN1535_c0_g1_i1.p1
MVVVKGTASLTNTVAFVSIHLSVSCLLLAGRISVTWTRGNLPYQHRLKASRLDSTVTVPIAEVTNIINVTGPEDKNADSTAVVPSASTPPASSSHVS